MAEERTIKGTILSLITPQFILACGSAFLLWLLLNQIIGQDKNEAGPWRDVIIGAIGFIMGSMVGPAWQFFFGNTKSSEEKTEALRANAETMRRAGVRVGSEQNPDGRTPEPVVAIPPEYAAKSDDELRVILAEREIEAASMNRDEMLAKLAELDAQPPGV